MSNRKYFKLGLKAGKAAGSWVFDGNTDISQYRYVLKGIEDGDPVVMDMQPAPLSGEWAGESIVGIFGKVPTDQQLSDYEEGYSQGFWDEVETTARSAVDYDNMQREQESNYLAGLGV